MSDTFLDVLQEREYVRDEGGMQFPVKDYVLEVPVDRLPLPEFMMSDCVPEEWYGAVVDHLRDYIAKAVQMNGPEASVGAFMAFDGPRAYICFRQIYVGDTEYTAMSELKEMGPEKSGEAGVQKIAALMRAYHDLLNQGVDAAREMGYAWLPDEFRVFAEFYDDDAVKDWADVLWFAYDYNESMVQWLQEQSFEARAEWAKHPCNNALVIRFESESDAQKFELKWSPAQGQA